jgi:sterol desaturase/sphingolipid hydroxylase (fatty acid hydroxylase superfamily)
MHRKRWWLPNWVWKDHAIEHHKNERNDLNIDLPLYNHLIVGSPVILASTFIGLPCLLALLTVFAFHSYTWTKIHRGIHELEQNWLMKTNFYKKAKRHHELHHKRPGKNFGVVFLFTDSLFRTKIK